MSEKKKEPVPELRPLRSLLADSTLDADARLLGRALEQMHDQPPALPPDAGWAALPDAGWAALEDQALRLARRRRWRYHLGEAWRGLGTAQLALGAAAVVAIFVLGGLGARSLSSSSRQQRSLAERAHDAPAADLRDHIDLRAAFAVRSVTLRSGARLELADGQAEVDQREPHRPSIQLRRGRVALSVPPMRSGGRLIVATPDAEVIVHGTRFVVQRQESDDATEVSVQEGLVEVRPLGGRRRALFLRAGEHVLVPSGVAYVRQLSAQVSALIDAGRCDDKSAALLDAYLDVASVGSDVSEALYQKGSCAAVKGDVTAALSAFEQVAHSASSELRADNALARIAQLRASGNVSDGATAWRRYLQRFPQGQHRESAHRFLQELRPGKSD